MKIKPQGFTLIELLIAISILSGILLVGNYSYQLLAQRWQNEIGQFNSNRHFGRQLTLFENTLTGIQPFIVVNEAQGRKPGFIFEGSETSLLSISKVGLMQQSYPEIFKLSVEKQSNGLLQLVYQSKSTEAFLLKFTEQEIRFDKEYVIFRDLSDIKFNYLGWDSILQKSEERPRGKSASWRSSYSGIDTQQLPEEIAVLMKKEGKDLLFTIALDKNTLRYLTPYLDNSQ
ncbi:MULTISPECIES: PulJ/GspJ family protein [Pseudoalteromonas]|uniref:Prepilin-type N-terminal cleavage/methylation domain-containing protein n=1 Tax=Pseudoalteromonas aurantia 208 TaxID=1314867 RepID=A0ABR9EE93_9GAMM|nr:MULTISPECIES: prepilin-type N-terminal cleavage/methylation domain-containing protein [Pseudoalteromonas]MBE0369295.1 hypothetical protein [Pseudoalteromonas aurantia 208]MBQ4844346.1 prepilin-type N-terminal cleavage/methylation domain-containing protein [Pseudoalteromonas sp. MMG005]